MPAPEPASNPARILLLFAHPAYQRSRINHALVEAVRDVDGLTLHDLYECYPDGFIDARREQALLSAHDIVVVQHPLYWFSCPPLLRLWQDTVLTNGFAYGHGGRALAGKRWLSVVSTGGGVFADAHCEPERFAVGEFLRPFEGCADLCGMSWEAPFIVQGGHALDMEALAARATDYRERLLALAAEGNAGTAGGC
ncbi:NAD(P)H-dependent oxidoreductase [Uliginosibacterium sp. H1]|uniref:NAD(P)H-dependent oxidoreductase n=1 Tax=Uliginosibacterium sp. H1 TaxID=3114757 RepID=UPI002E18106F|nr:NAD(P)H-dependent oxidoreductase [Uliginosibacterium sp. H1]